MTNQQWVALQQVIQGKFDHVLAAYISDSAFLPGNYGITPNEYFMDDEAWFRVHRQSMEDFPEVLFIPGFWADYGMCTETSAFGSKCSWIESFLPHPGTIFREFDDAEDMEVPNPRVDGMPPFTASRMRRMRPRVEAMGHAFKFASSRGPFTISQFLLGADEFMIALKTQPDEAKVFLDKVTTFIVNWLRYQKEMVPTIDGIQINDDILGFVGAGDFQEFAVPCLQRIFDAFPTSVRLLHNDANGMASAPYLESCGINVFNFSYHHGLEEMRSQVGKNVVLMGNVAPLQVMTDGDEATIRKATRDVLEFARKDGKCLLSVGGGLPQGLPKEKLRIAIDELNCFNKK